MTGIHEWVVHTFPLAPLYICVLVPGLLFIAGMFALIITERRGR